jgi:hypothetical protein
LITEIGPRPLDEHHEAVPKTDQVHDVHEQPRQPAEPAFQLQPSEIGDGRRAADGRHVPEIPILERPARLTIDAADDISRGVPARLNCDLGDTWQRPAVCPGDRRKIADDEDLRVPRDREVRLYDDSPRSIRRDAERRPDG